MPKIIVIYPQPKDAAAFEKAYNDVHLPMAIEKLAGKSKAVLTKFSGAPNGTPHYYRMAEIHFPSMGALQACVESPGGQETIQHAISISNGGPPIFMIAEEEQVVEF